MTLEDAARLVAHEQVLPHRHYHLGYLHGRFGSDKRGSVEQAWHSTHLCYIAYVLGFEDGEGDKHEQAR